MNMRVERKKYLEINMWNKIKSKLPITCISVVIGCLFYFNYQADNQL